MKKLLPALLVFATLYYLQSCGCKQCGMVNLDGLNLGSYPTAINDQWVYQVTNNISGIVDTATFTITGIASSNNDSTVYKTTTMVANAVVDSGTLLISMDSVTYRPSGTQSLFEYLKLVYPIVTNGSWQGYYAGDSLHVLAAYINQNVLNTNYSNVFELVRHYVTPAYAVQDTVYILPNLGIIQESLVINSMQNISAKTLKLVSSNL